MLNAVSSAATVKASARPDQISLLRRGDDFDKDLPLVGMVSVSSECMYLILVDSCGMLGNRFQDLGVPESLSLWVARLGSWQRAKYPLQIWHRLERPSACKNKNDVEINKEQRYWRKFLEFSVLNSSEPRMLLSI